MGASEAFVAPRQTPPLALLIAVTAPIIAFVAGLAVSHALREFVLAADLRFMTAIQAWRVGGFSFLALYTYGILFSSFMFHHLQRDEKEGMLREVRRVLTPGGIFTLLDFGGPESGETGLARLIHSSHHIRENSAERILALMSQAAFADSKKVSEGTMFFGRVRINYYQASVPI